MTCYGDSFTFLYVGCSYLTGNTPICLQYFLRGWLCFLYTEDVGTSQETHLWVSMVCYKVSFTSLYVDDVCTSQETHLWVSMVC
jgi:hypothetical protein